MKLFSVLKVGIAVIAVLLCGVMIADDACADTVYRYPSGRVKMIILSVPDAGGNTLYVYADENWQGTGRGRVIQSRRQAAVNGELSYSYFYYADATGYRRQMNAYSDANWTNLVAVYTYYNNAANRLQMKTLTTKDTVGNILYVYQDENWQGRGYGRVIQTRRQTALNGELSHSYSYFTDAAGRRSQIKGYSDANWANLTATYEYYNNETNRMRYKTLVNPDAAGMTFYAYRDENWNNQGYGRVTMSRRQTALDHEILYFYEYYASGFLKTKVAISDTNPGYTAAIYTYYDNASNRLFMKITYNAYRVETSRTTYNDDAYNRIATKQVWVNGVEVSRTNYYNNETNRLKATILAAPDASGNIKYRYIDENWNGRGYGRLSATVRQTAVNGELAYGYAYYDATDRLSKKTAYSDADWTKIVAVYSYSNDTANSFVSKDAYIYTEGILSKVETRDAAGMLVSDAEFTYFAGSNRVMTKTVRVFTPESNANGYPYYPWDQYTYNYLDEDHVKDAAGLTYGRLNYVDIDYYGEHFTQFRGVKIYTFYTGAGVLPERYNTITRVSHWGVTTFVENYYNDASNRMHSKAVVNYGTERNPLYTYTRYANAEGSAVIMELYNQTLDQVKTLNNTYNPASPVINAAELMVDPDLAGTMAVQETITQQNAPASNYTTTGTLATNTIKTNELVAQ